MRALGTLRMASTKKLRVYHRVVMAAISASVGYLSSTLKPSHGGVPRIASRSVAATHAPFEELICAFARSRTQNRD